jgi:hypothetical protein
MSIKTIPAILTVTIALLCMCDKSGTGPDGSTTVSQISVLSPVSGSRFLVGRDSVTVTFTPAMDSVMLVFSFNVPLDRSLDTIEAVARPNSTTAKFVVPGGHYSYSDSATVQVVDPAGVKTAGTSQPFSTKWLSLTSPTDGGTYTHGDTIRVRWETSPSASISGIVVKLSTDGGLTFGSNALNLAAIQELDTNGLPNPQWGNFPIVISDTMSMAVIKIYDYERQYQIYDMNRTPFAVR